MKALLYLAAYSAWVLSFRLISLTVLTYLLMGPTTKFQDITDAFGSSEVSLMGFSAILFVVFHYALFPLDRKKQAALLNRERVEKEFLPGFIRGASVSGSIVILLLLLGIYKYLGSFIQFNEAPLALVNITLRTITLCALAYFESYIFHYRMAPQLGLPPVTTALSIGVFYCAVKAMQFHLGVLQLFSLFLLAVSLQLRCQKSGGFARAAGLWAAILVVINPLLSLPIFGNDFGGVLLIKYSALPPESPSASIIRLLSGGLGGPLSSFVFQGLLLLDITRHLIENTKPVPEVKSTRIEVSL